MSILAFDWGQKYVGYASSDPEGIAIQPRGVILRSVSKMQSWILVKSDIPKINKIIEEWEAELLILGLPLKSDGTDSTSSKNARDLAKQLESQFKITVHLTNEHLTSWEASSTNPKSQHAEAAALILKSYFEDKKHKRITT